MRERSEEQILSRLFDLENEGLADRRVELEGERYIALIHDPDTGRDYVLQHGVDETEGVEIPEGTEFLEYRSHDEAERAFDALVRENAGQVVEEDSDNDVGDIESGGPELRDMYSDEDSDPLVQPEGAGDPFITRDETAADPSGENIADDTPHV